MTRESRISDWIQIAASLGVFAGLLLVAFEIRESNRVATSESIGAITQSWMELQLVGAESDISGILAKSYEDPYNLSNEEIMRLWYWYESVVSIYEWWLRAYELDTVEFDPIPNFAVFAADNLGSPVGRAYLEYARSWGRPELIDAANVALENRPPDQSPPIIAFMRDIMQQQKNESVEE